jgi:4-amino-4-deoxy-L-arabinose transferase-like glycosyltransferase
MQDSNGKPINPIRIPFPISLLGIAIASSILKIALLLADVLPFNADEAIVGLMARNFLNGDWEIFFYGQAYMGTLDASLVAGLFALFGPQIVLIRVLQILLYIGTILTTGYLGLLIFKSERIGLLAAIFMAIPTVNVTLYTTVSLGGYGEVLFLGNLLIIAALKIYRKPQKPWYILWGFCAGLGIWAFGLILIYVLPTFILLVYKVFQEPNRGERALNLGLSAGAFFLGLSPWITWALSNGFSPLFQELFGSAISGASSSNPFFAILAHLYNFLLFGTTVIFGLRPPWEIRWLAQPLLPVALAFWLFILVLAFQNLSKQDEAPVGRWVLVGVMITLVAGYVFTPFGADPSGRYFLTFMIPLSLFAGEFCVDLLQRPKVGRWGYLLPVVILTYNLWGTWQAANRFPPGLTTQFDSVSWIDHRFDDELIQFLKVQGETRGYSNYWVTYPIAFQSDEEIIFVPYLPYHQDFRYTSRDSRYQPYDEMVEESDRVAYITTNHPALDEFLRNSFRDQGLRWEEKWIGDYHIYYQLSDIVRPLDLKIYELHPAN